MKKTKSKGFSIGIVPTTLILAGITLAFILLVSRNTTPVGINEVSNPTSETAPAITSDKDLEQALKELDSNNLDSLDQDLNNVSTETSKL